MWKIWTGSQFIQVVSGADPGFFIGGGAPLRNDVTDIVYTKKKASSQGWGGAPPAPSP